MGKAPAGQFYYRDWASDMEEFSLEIEGAWIRINCKLWYSPTRGELSKTLDQWARILRVEEEKTLEILRYIQSEEIGDVPTDLTQPNGKITVICRRTTREENKKKGNRLRQDRFRKKHTDNTEVTPPSSTSSSTSSPNNKEQATPALPKGHYAIQIETNYVKRIDDLCASLEKAHPGYPYKFVQMNCKSHPEAIIEVLKIVKKYTQADKLSNGPWPISNATIAKISQNYHERENTRAHEAIQQELLKCDLPHIKNLFKDVPH